MQVFTSTFFQRAQLTACLQSRLQDTFLFFKEKQSTFALHYMVIHKSTLCQRQLILKEIKLYILTDQSIYALVNSCLPAHTLQTR